MAMEHAASLVTASLAPGGAALVTVEARFDCSDRGGTRVLLTGLPDGALRETRTRLPATLASAGIRAPQGELHLNLAPATRPKRGGLPDLGLACAMAAALGHCAPARLADLLVVGEVDLSGGVRTTPGILAATLAARTAGIRSVLAPREALPLLLRVPDIALFPVEDLRSALDHLRGVAVIHRARRSSKGDCAAAGPHGPGRDSGSAHAGRPRGGGSATAGRKGRLRGGVPLSGPSPAEGPSLGIRMEGSTVEAREEVGVPRLDDVRGQHLAKRALLVCAAGSHSLLMRGSPGVGKSMLAQRLPGLLPPLEPEEELELLALADGDPLRPTPRNRLRPLRAPHHTTSFAGLVGGGRDARPGEVSLAHRGVLFLDELPEFRRDALEALREPLEAGEVRLARAGEHVEHAARVLLVAAMNPCPCGWHGHPTRRCTCHSSMRSRYAARLSGPLLDRFDLLVDLDPPTTESLLGETRATGEPESSVAAGSASAQATSGAEDSVGSTAAKSAVARGSVMRSTVTQGTATGPRSKPGRPLVQEQPASGQLTDARAHALLGRARAAREARGQRMPNGRLGSEALEQVASLDPRGRQLLRRAAAERSLSARAVQALRRVARTLADLGGAEDPTADHVAEALLLHGTREAR